MLPRIVEPIDLSTSTPTPSAINSTLTGPIERLERKIRRHVLGPMPKEATFLEDLDLGRLLIEYRIWRGQVQRLIGKRSKTKSRPSASISSGGGQWAIPVAGQICVRYPSIWLVSATAPLRISCPQ